MVTHLAELFIDLCAYESLWKHGVISAAATHLDPKKTCALVDPQYRPSGQNSRLPLTSCLIDLAPVVVFWLRFLYYL